MACRPILPSALVDIVAGRDKIDDTTFKAKANNLKKNPRPRPRTDLSRQTLSRTRAGTIEAKANDTIFVNYNWQVFPIFKLNSV